MSFRYDVLNIEILDDAKAIFTKPANEWTEEETRKAQMIIAAMQIVASQAPKPSKVGTSVCSHGIPTDRRCPDCSGEWRPS
jgi:hypothetical protein